MTDRPLAGTTVVVTRPREQAGEFSALLEAEGADVVEFPTIRIVPVEDDDRLRRAAREAPGYDWLVFTSRNGVRHFFDALAAEGLGPDHLSGPRICAIGPGTGEALEERGVGTDLIPDDYIAEGVVDAMDGAVELEGTRVLLPRAEVARSELPEGLRARGARVDVVIAYRTLPAETSRAGALRRRLEAGEIDVLTFTASSTVRNWHDVLGAYTGEAAVACIGPVTAETARELGLGVDVVAEEYTIPGLLEACRRHLGG